MAGSLVPWASAQYTQLGSKITPSGAVGATFFGWSVAISADGNTAIVGAAYDTNILGAAFIFVRNNGVWSQQAKLVGAGYTGTEIHQGSGVAISADGNTAALAGSSDNGDMGAVWVFTRTNGAWTQQGPKLLGAGSVGSPGRNGADMGISLSMSGDGNTIIAGGPDDSNYTGAAWIFTRSNGTWTQFGNKLTGSDVAAPSQFGETVAISQDGYTAVIGANIDNNFAGAAWIFVLSNGVWTQQGKKLAGAGEAGSAVAISADGNTVAVGVMNDNNGVGEASIYTRTGTTWSLQSKLSGTGNAGLSGQGAGVALSADGNTAVVGGEEDNHFAGAFWIFKRKSGVWTQQGGKLTGSGAVGQAYQGLVAISGDGSTVLDVSEYDNNNNGALWIFVSPTPEPVSASPASGSGTTQVFTFTFSDAGGYQDLTVLDVLIRDVLDGRQSCYVAFVPSGPTSGSVYLVDDQGDAGGPYSGLVLPGGGSVFNSQCSITGAGSSASGNGNTLTLTLAITFTPSFAGNKVLYLSAQDASSNSGWSALGVWNNPGAASAGPGVSGMSPARTSGFTQTYTFTFTDTNGYQDIAVADVLINTAINGVGACYLAIVPMGAGSAAIDLVDNTGDAGGPYAGMILPTSNVVSNGQCSISGNGSSVSANGNTLTVTLAVSFSPSFAGNQIVYSAARSNALNTGWQSVGTVTVP
ncbi:hypothetical protein SBA4_1420011 [Candidatus Sulfopaludibacter sp. SbA4]|nr:hypothetical protein SBA4_1420011 [Candidatus Sulfopaludibacter sp. SbA4]